MKFFIFKPKLSLWDEFLKEIPKNDDFPDFHELTLYMIFCCFPEIIRSDDGYFREKF